MEENILKSELMGLLLPLYGDRTGVIQPIPRIELSSIIHILVQDAHSLPSFDG